MSIALPATRLRVKASGKTYVMTVGTSIFLIAVGAILRYAVTATVTGISLATVGLILMLAGVLGLIVSLLYMFVWRPRHGVDRVIERDPYDRTNVF